MYARISLYETTSRAAPVIINKLCAYHRSNPRLLYGNRSTPVLTLIGRTFSPFYVGENRLDDITNGLAISLQMPTEIQPVSAGEIKCRRVLCGYGRLCPRIRGQSDSGEQESFCLVPPS